MITSPSTEQVNLSVKSTVMLSFIYNSKIEHSYIYYSKFNFWRIVLIKSFITGAAIAGGILFLFVSQTWIVVIVFWAIIAGLTYLFKDS